MDSKASLLCAIRAESYNLSMPVFKEKQEELEHYETMMGVPRGRLAVTMDMITDAMALVGQHGVYCQSQRWPGKPVMDVQIMMKNLTDAKELLQSVMEELKKKTSRCYPECRLAGCRKSSFYYQLWLWSPDTFGTVVSVRDGEL